MARVNRDDHAPTLLVIPTGTTESYPSHQVTVYAGDPSGRIKVRLERAIDDPDRVVFDLAVEGVLNENAASARGWSAMVSVPVDGIDKIERVAYALLHAVADARRCGFLGSAPAPAGEAS